VKERTSELTRAHKELDSAKRLSDIGTLAATIAHELRNPLSVIKTAAFNIKRKKEKNVPITSHLANIDKKISESDQIIKNLLSYSRIKVPRYENLSCLKLMHEAIENIEHKYSKWDAVILHSCACDKEDYIEADPIHMSELFSNILDNAYQSLERNKGTITAEGHYIKEDNKYTVIFTDNGIGIGEEILPKIFDPFFTTRSKGLGLGLTVCKQIVELHGGKIDLVSQKGKGASVIVELPIRRT